VLGARVPIVLTSRADSNESPHGIVRRCNALCRRAASCPDNRRVMPMDTILVVNAGSSSVKFQVFAVDGDGRLRRQIKGQMDGIGSRPRLRATGPGATRWRNAPIRLRAFQTFRPALMLCERLAAG